MAGQDACTPREEIMSRIKSCEQNTQMSSGKGSGKKMSMKTKDNQ